MVTELSPEAERWIEERGGPNIGPLLPYLAQRPNGKRDEHPAYCPLHEDATPSMSINFRKGVAYCHAGCGGGSIRDLLYAENIWIPKEDHPAFARRR